MKAAVAPRQANPLARHCRAGVGLRLPHLAEAATANPDAAWFEIHPENFLANPHARELLRKVAENRALSMHSVGISVGSADGLDKDYLLRVKALTSEITPLFVSGHLAWSSHDGVFLNDLLPLPFDDKTLGLVALHVQQVQEELGCQYLVENPASYFGFESSTLAETQFLGELAARSGCGLLCDVSNVFVSGWNLGFDPYQYISEFPGQHVVEMHLGGFAIDDDPTAETGSVLIDSHDDSIAAAVWALYEHAVRTFGPRATLIERDSKLPSLPALADEARQADAILLAATAMEESHAVAG